MSDWDKHLTQDPWAFVSDEPETERDPDAERDRERDEAREEWD